MTLPLEIVFHDMLPLPSVASEIRRRASRFEPWAPEVTRCRVTVEADASRRHVGHPYRVHLHLRLAGSQIAVSSQPGDEDIHRAVRATFEAAARQLEEHAQRLHRQTKPHHLVRYGSIETLSDDGTGVIVGEDGETYHFDRSHVVEPGFDRLAIGQHVGFLEGITRAGREARRIAAAHPPPPDSAWM